MFLFFYSVPQLLYLALCQPPLCLDPPSLSSAYLRCRKRRMFPTTWIKQIAVYSFSFITSFVSSWLHCDSLRSLQSFQAQVANWQIAWNANPDGVWCGAANDAAANGISHSLLPLRLGSSTLNHFQWIGLRGTASVKEFLKSYATVFNP